jgi:hypothetical protein
MSTRRIFFAIVMCVLCACDSKVEPSVPPPISLPPPSFRISLETPLVEPLESVPVSIDAVNLTVARSTVTWTSSDPAIADVSPGGLVTGHFPGDATITGQVNGFIASTVVHVGWRSDTRLSIGGPHLYLDAGVFIKLSAMLLRSSGRTPLSGGDIEWTSSNPGVALSVVAGSTVTLATRAAGSTTLIGRYHGLVDSAVVDVGGIVPSLGYFYSGDAFITDEDWYGGKFWTPATGNSFSTAGFVSSTWLAPYSTQPDLGWVGPSLPLGDAVMYVASLDNLPCTAYAQADSGFHFTNVGSPLVDCYDSHSKYYESVRMEFVAFRPGGFTGALATIYPSGTAVTTSAGGIGQTSATADSRSYALSGVARDSVFWFVSPGAEPVATCRIAPADGSLSQPAVRVICEPLPFAAYKAAFEPAFYAVGFGANARRGAAPIGLAEVSNGVVTRKAGDGLDIVAKPTSAQSTDIVVSGSGVAAFDRVPAVLVTAIGLASGTCGLTEPSHATPTTVTLTVTCAAGISAFTLGVIY